SAPRLECQCVAVFEEAHRKLAYGCTALPAMCHPVDQETARTADTFAAIVFEGDGRLLSVDQVLVQGVEHFKERHVGRHVLNLVANKGPVRVLTELPPNPESENHGFLVLPWESGTYSKLSGSLWRVG